MRSLLVIAALLAVTALAADFEPVKYKACRSKFEVKSVEAIGCPKDAKQRCLFKRNSEPVIRIGFVPDRDVDALETKVRAKIEQTFSEFSLENTNACKGQNVTCPLKAGQLYYYSQKVKVAEEYPTVNVLVNWLLNHPSTFEDPKYKDEEGNRNLNDLCILFHAKVEA
ncbi:unnamed protein product [Bursaphelenchus xylophilus]|uniref:(pine wood nematode) hypothetical protein n=1 Tax=Bursaphelenchus xylophilus TaxID=6326 RepID=A0A1I7S7U5_BURXY|nr:unnamed protein product [Bursaphelenchus xylophilus]CAG9087034.1 unnamed protein product [Bursaphelenchus xylophilus]